MFRFILRDKAFNQKLFSLTLPISLQNLMLAMVAAADAFMLGRVSQNAMAAVSLAAQITFLQSVLLSGIVMGIGALGSQYWGKGDPAALSKIFGLSVRDSSVISILFFAVCFWFPEQLMLLFTHDDLLVSLGAEYLKITSWSYILIGISQCYLAMMRISNHAVRSAVIGSGAVVLNIIFNFIFIFGFAGIPAMGVKGAALATVIARAIELVWSIFTTYGKTFLPLQLRTVITFHRQLIWDFWKCVLPIMGSCLLWGIGFASYTAIMGHMGRDAAAANAVAAVARDLICCLCTGIAGGSAILIGNELGSGHLKRGKLYGNRVIMISALIGFFSSLVILASLPIANMCLKLTDQAKGYMIGMFLILVVYMIGKCICTVVINGIFAAGGDTLFDLYSLLVCMWGIALPCAFFGAFWLHLPVLVIYACTCLDEVGKVPWLVHHYRKYKWVKNLTRDL